MQLRSTLVIVTFLLLLPFMSSSSLFAQESYTITKAQIGSLSANLTTLKDLITNLRLNLDSYKQELQVTALELQQSEGKLELAENESNIFILKLQNQQNLLTEQSKSLANAKTSLKRLRRKNRAKDVLFALIIGGLIAIRR